MGRAERVTTGGRGALALEGASQVVFLLVMLGAAGLTLLRMGAATAFLRVEDFAVYASVVAAGSFLAGPVSFGAVEGTIKLFPRLVAQGRRPEMLAAARVIVRTLLLRTIIPGSIAIAIGLAAGLPIVVYGGLAVFIAFSTALSGLVASMQRAEQRPGRLAAGTVIRSATAAVVVSVAALSRDLLLVLVCEFAAMAAATLLTRRLFFGPAQNGRQGPPAAPPSGGRAVFAAMMMVSAPFYLDRFYVAATVGLGPAGQYSLLALFLLAASLFISTVAQRVGPEAIVLIHEGHHRSAIVRVAMWSVFNALGWVAAIGLFAVALDWQLLPAAIERYAISPDYLVPIAVTGVLLNSILLEQLVIGLDRERDYARAAGGFFASVILAALLGWILDADLDAIMWGLALCRAFYCAVLAAVVAREVRARRPNHGRVA